jgi:formylmethanofuran dehydrogenase subunit E
MKGMAVLLGALLLAAAGGQAGETGVARNAAEPEWFFPEWLASGPYAPVFDVCDTENKYGRYASLTKRVTIKDLIKLHGHFCGGLVESAAALRVAFDRLFTDGIIDRTDLRIISNNSACGGDVAAYLTGARVRFGSHRIDGSLTESEFIVQRVSDGRTVHVKLNPATYPDDVKVQMKRIESGAVTPAEIDRFQELQWAYARRLITRPLAQAFLVNDLAGFAWPEPVCGDLGCRKDNDYKNAPRR